MSPVDDRGSPPVLARIWHAIKIVHDFGSALVSSGGKYGGMPELVWDEVRSFFDPDLMGSLPDVWVADTSVEDWQAVLDLIEAQGWGSEYLEGGVVMPLPSAEQVLSRPADVVCSSLRVWPTPDVLVIFWFRSDDEIDFDVDLRELQSQERLDILCEFITAIGRRLGKPVMMSSEGDWERDDPILEFDVEADRVVLLAQSWFD